MLILSFALLLGTAFLRPAAALSCPATSGLFVDSTTGLSYCCPGVRLTGSQEPVCTNRNFPTGPSISCRWNIPAGSSMRQGRAGFTVDQGAKVYNLAASVVGGKGDDVAGMLGGNGAYSTLSLRVFGGRPLPSPLNAAFLLNIEDGQELESTSSIRGVDYGRGGGYSAVADADCLAGRTSLQFSAADECRWNVAHGGGGASKFFPGRRACSDAQPAEGNSLAPVTGSDVLTSAGALPHRDSEGRYSGGGGGGGIRGGGASSGPLQDSATEATGPGCGGTWGLANSKDGWFAHTGVSPAGATAPYVNLVMQIVATCELIVAGDAATVPSTTAVETTSRAVDETTLSGATVTSTIDEVSTVTPSTSSVYTTEDVFTTPSTSVVETTETSVTTPLTSTVIVKTTDTTLAAGRRTPVATRYVTDTVTTEPPTSVATATQTVPTGFADCTTYRVVYPSTCCPSSLLTLTPAPEQRARRRSVHLEPRTLTDNPTLTSGETTTTTTIDYTATVTESDVTVVTTSTEVVEASTPLTAVTESRTLEAPTPLTTSTVVEYSGAPTPLVTTIQTALARGLATSLRAVLFPTLTVSTQTTTTLETPVTTTTVTEEVQSTVCAEQPIRAYSRCPNTGEAGAATRVKSVERARLNGLKAQSGGRSVTVDCGASGIFSY